MTVDFSDAMARVEAHAPFLRRLMQMQPKLVGTLRDGDWEAALAVARANRDGDLPAPVRLRREKRGLALTLAIGDLAGALSLEQVTRHLSDFADYALDTALAEIIAERTPDEAVRGFTVLALGKHGSRELNYSSDIDLIFLYDPDTLPCRPREEASDASRRIGTALSRALNDINEEGYVFRVDTRLRPASEVSPIALPVDAAIRHYESSALTWEQAAFIRARCVAGDRALGEEFLATIQPFVWRRSLDYGAIRNIGQITARIRDHYAEGQMLRPGYDLKRGTGGIREVEFYAQVHQLIFGGRQPELRLPATLDALAALAEAGHIGTEEAGQLSIAYRILRTAEHRLQMVDDRQTHQLPEQAEAIDNVARLDGRADGAALIEHLRPHVVAVAAIYNAILPDSDEAEQSVPRDEEALKGWLAERRIAEPELFAVHIARWRSGKYRALQSTAAREAFEAVLAELVEAFAAAPQPEQALIRLDALFERLPSVLNFFRLLEARPQLRERVARIFGHAPTLATDLSRRIEWLDGLIEDHAFDLPPTVPELAANIGRTDGQGDYQLLLDRVRDRVGEARFALGAQLVEGRHDALAIAGGYARVAEAAMQVLTDATAAEFAQTHGVVPGAELVILALGRLGGEELSHASDLDIVFLFSGDQNAESDGRRPLGATHYFNRLAQRVITALTVPTAAGPLYEVDTRLRPSGKDGLLAVSIDSFLKYQREKAWTWEHMALTRSRPVYGSADARSALQAGIEDVLSSPREAEPLRKAVRKMRLEMVAHRPPLGPLDAKLIEGGLVDWEFIVHFLQLRENMALTPRLPDAARLLAEAGHLDAAMVDAHALMTRLLIALRLIAPDGEYPQESSRALIATAAGTADWEALLAQFRTARQTVIDEWNRLLRPDPDEKLEDLQ